MSGTEGAGPPVQNGPPGPRASTEGSTAIRLGGSAPQATSYFQCPLLLVAGFYPVWLVLPPALTQGIKAGEEGRAAPVLVVASYVQRGDSAQTAKYRAPGSFDLDLTCKKQTQIRQRSLHALP